MIVVDTSVLVALFRGGTDPAVERLCALERAGEPFAVPTVCCQELLQGARDEGEWRLLETYLGTQLQLAPRDHWVSHRAAARLYFDCRRQGITPRSTLDCLIAQLCIENHGVLLHNDGDFTRIAQVAPLRLWDAPR
ncbi:MAG: PIN domain-containing protein [Pseudomonadota bacterium]